MNTKLALKRLNEKFNRRVESGLIAPTMCEWKVDDEGDEHYQWQFYHGGLLHTWLFNFKTKKIEITEVDS
jgi:hypothetical protein